jgi:tight adherence protein B
MPFHLDNQYVFYAFAALSAVLFVEAIYLLFFSNVTYRKRINRRLDLMKGHTDRESVLVQLRRERGLTSDGDLRLPVAALNRLILQSGLSMGVGRLCVYIGIVSAAAFGAVMVLHGDPIYATGLALFCCTLAPLFWLRFLRGRRRRKFGQQFPDAIDIIVRSLRAGHPVPIAISMVGREMPDPVGSEFGIVSDEVAYGADLETAMRNLYFRVGQDDLPLFVTAVAIQGSTGGDPVALQDASQDQGAGGGRPRLRDHPVGVADRRLPHHQRDRARLLPQRLAFRYHQDRARRGDGVDAGGHPHHVPHGQFQDLTGRARSEIWTRPSICSATRRPPC